jgi:ubiquinone biosynthesis protein
MGPTFVKLGQILATRSDLFAPQWIKEFEKLQDRAQPVPFVEIKKQLLEDMGALPGEIFADFIETPIAAASIGQVHKAALEDGSIVVVKVRRPGIRPKVEADLRLLNQIAEIAEKEVQLLKRFRPREVIHQFTLSMRRELDLAGECRSAERIASAFEADPNIIVPRVYWEWTSERVNVQEYIDGISGRDLAAVDKAGLDRQLLAKRGAEAVLKMILEDGYFHADPHPGNTFYLPNNRIAFIDFGMVGRLSELRRFQVIDLLKGLVDRDTDTVVKLLLKWSSDVHVDKDSLTLDIDSFIDQYHNVPLKDLDITEILTDLTTLLRDYQLNLPPDLTLLFKAFITLEGMGQQLDPDFNMVDVAGPFLRRALLSRYSPDSVAKRGWQNFTSMVELFTGLPDDLHRLLETARHGALGIRMDISRPAWFIRQLDRVVNRLSISLVTSALIVGSSIAMTVEGASSFVGTTAFIGAVFGAIWLLFSIWRSG